MALRRAVALCVSISCVAGALSPAFAAGAEDRKARIERIWDLLYKKTSSEEPGKFMRAASILVWDNPTDHQLDCAEATAKARLGEKVDLSICDDVPY